MAAAQTGEEQRKASRFYIRGLHRCKSETCGVYWNRDYNAAVNIGKRFRTLYASGDTDLPVPGDLDLEFEKLHAEMNL
jgi:transposase